MKFIRNIFLKKLIITCIIFVLLFSFIIPNRAYAWDVGGILFKPISALTTLIIDAINLVLQMIFKGVTSFDESALMSPEEIFNGSVTSLNANIFEVDAYNSNLAFIGGGSLGSGIGSGVVMALKRVVAGMYEVLRNFCAVVMLCMLIYTGIRIVLSTASAAEKKEWMNFLMDWVKALLLLIFVHIIMISIFYISDTLMEAFKDDEGLNISRQLRMQEYGSWTFSEELVVLIMYGYTTYLTIIFAIAYMKRLLYVIVLIIIAPIVSIMYCFGKNGKAIFGRWFKEYTFAVLVQPYHFLIYYILISIPIRLAGVGTTGSLLPSFSFSNIFIFIYCLISMSCIRPFEKFLRWIFGMDGKVAGQASFESGKQTWDAGKKLVMSTVETAVKIGSVVATGGASAAMGVADVGAAASGMSGIGAAASGMSGIGDAASAMSGFGDGDEEGAAAAGKGGFSILGALKEIPRLGLNLLNTDTGNKFIDIPKNIVRLGIGGEKGANFLGNALSDQGIAALKEYKDDVHGFVDTLYMPGDAPKDWKKNKKDDDEEKAKKKKGASAANSAGSPNMDDLTEEAYETMVESMPDIQKGIKNLGKGKTNNEVEKELQDSINDLGKNINQLTNAVTKIRMDSGATSGISPQEIASAIAPYINQGVNDPNVLERLTGLEGRMSASLPADKVNTQTVMISDKIIEKALRDGLKDGFKGLDISSMIPEIDPETSKQFEGFFENEYNLRKSAGSV